MPVARRPLRLLIEGPPKVGKSTAVNRLVKGLQQYGITVGGFVTLEQREHGQRVGFVIQDIAGPQAVIAHVDYSTPVHVGRFGVDVPAFESVGLPALRHALARCEVIVIDEIARMGLASPGFVAMVGQVMDSPGPVVATIHVHSHPFTDALKQRRDVTRVQITTENREAMPGRLFSSLIQR